MQMAKMGAMVLAVALMLVFPCACSSYENVPRLEKESLIGWLSDPQVIILDVRTPKDWEASGQKIKDAVRQDPKEAKTWAASLPKDKKIVLYCA